MAHKCVSPVEKQRGRLVDVGDTREAFCCGIEFAARTAEPLFLLLFDMMIDQIAQHHRLGRPPLARFVARVQQLLDVTRESLELGIQECRPGRRLSDVSHAIQTHVERHGFAVVRAFVGHGIGRALHEEPQVPNFGDPGRGPQLRTGMVLAIEPMVTMGGWEVRILDDGWTAVTQDGSLAAHFEHTIAVTDSGPEVLTSKGGGSAGAA